MSEPSSKIVPVTTPTEYIKAGEVLMQNKIDTKVSEPASKWRKFLSTLWVYITNVGND